MLVTLTIRFLIFVCGEWLCVHMCGYMHMCLHAWRTQTSTPGIVPQVPCTSFFVCDTGSLTDLELTKKTRLAGHQVPGTHLSLPLQGWGCRHVSWLFDVNVASGD